MEPQNYQFSLAFLTHIFRAASEGVLVVSFWIPDQPPFCTSPFRAGVAIPAKFPTSHHFARAHSGQVSQFLRSSRPLTILHEPIQGRCRNSCQVPDHPPFCTSPFRAGVAIPAKFPTTHHFARAHSGQVSQFLRSSRPPTILHEPIQGRCRNSCEVPDHSPFCTSPFRAGVAIPAKFPTSHHFARAHSGQVLQFLRSSRPATILHEPIQGRCRNSCEVPDHPPFCTSPFRAGVAIPAKFPTSHHFARAHSGQMSQFLRSSPPPTILHETIQGRCRIPAKFPTSHHFARAHSGQVLQFLRSSRPPTILHEPIQGRCRNSCEVPDHPPFCTSPGQVSQFLQSSRPPTILHEPIQGRCRNSCEVPDHSPFCTSPFRAVVAIPAKKPATMKSANKAKLDRYSCQQDIY